MAVVKPNVSTVINYQAPEFMRSDYAKFITFLQKYYEYLEQNTKALGVIRQLENLFDVDESNSDDILSQFYTLFLPDFPQVLEADKKLVLKNIAEFYNSKGSIDSIKSFFRILYGEEVQVYLPKEDILKLNMGKWRKLYKIKINSLSSGTVSQLIGQQIWQIDPINGNKTVRAIVLDYDTVTGSLYISAENLVLSFDASKIVYSTLNDTGASVTFSLVTQLSLSEISASGMNAAPGDQILLPTADRNTENVAVKDTTYGTIESVAVETAGDNYSIFDEVQFTGINGSIAAKAKIASTLNDEVVSESSLYDWFETEDRISLEDGNEIRQEYGMFSSKALNPNLYMSDLSKKNVSPNSLASDEHCFLIENQENGSLTYSRASYTYDQGLMRAILPPCGAQYNFMLNWARNEGITVKLQDEELIIGFPLSSGVFTTKPATIIFEFATQNDYNNLLYYELTGKTTNVNAAPAVNTITSWDLDGQYIMDNAIGHLNQTSQIGIYPELSSTLTRLYPTSEKGFDPELRPLLYIRETNTTYGHNVNTERPWEYRFVFKKDAITNFKIYVMPVQYNIRANILIGETADTTGFSTGTVASGDEFTLESSYSDYIRFEDEVDSDILVRREITSINTSTNVITTPNGHGFVNNQIVRYNSNGNTPHGGMIDGQCYFVKFINNATFNLTSVTATTYAAGTNLNISSVSSGVHYIESIIGDGIVNPVDYTSATSPELCIYAKRASAGYRDLTLPYNFDPAIPIDNTTKIRTGYNYTYTGNRYYLYQSIFETTEYIIMEREELNSGNQVNLELEQDKRSLQEKEDYPTYPYLAYETITPVYVINYTTLATALTQAIAGTSPGKELFSDTLIDAVRKLGDIDNSGTLTSADTAIITGISNGTITDGTEYDYVVGDLFTFMLTNINRYGAYLTITNNPNARKSVVQSLKEIDLPQYAKVRVMVERKSLQSCDDINRGDQRDTRTWNDYADLSLFQEAFVTAPPQFYDEYSEDAKYVVGAIPSNYSEYTSGPGEIANYGTNMMVTHPNGASVVFGTTKAFELNNNRQISIVPFTTLDGDSFVVGNNNSFRSSVPQNASTNRRKEYFLIGFTLPKELNSTFDIPFEVNLRNIINSISDTVTYKSRAQGNITTMEPTIMIDFFSPSLATTNEKKHIVYYCNKAEYSQVSTDATKTVFEFFNCWSPNFLITPDTTVRDYIVTVKSLIKNDYIIDKVSDAQNVATQLITNTNGSYKDAFMLDLYINKSQNAYGKYINFYTTEADAKAETNSISFLGTSGAGGTPNFGNNTPPNDFFRNTIVSGVNVNPTFANPIGSRKFSGAYRENDILLTRSFNPNTDVTTGTPGIITIPQHGFTSGMWVRFRSDFNGTAPTGLTDNASYYVSVVSNSTIRLAINSSQYFSNSFVALTASPTTEKVCYLQALPQSLNFNSFKDLSYDVRRYQTFLLFLATAVDTISDIITIPNHELETGDSVVFDLYTAAPLQSIGGLNDNQTYYVISNTPNTLKLALTNEDAESGVAINLTSVIAGAGNFALFARGREGNINTNYYVQTPDFSPHNLKSGDRVTSYPIRRVFAGGNENSVAQTLEVDVFGVDQLRIRESVGLSVLTGTLSGAQISSISTTTGRVVTNGTTIPFYTGDQVQVSGIAVPTGWSTFMYAIKTNGTEFQLASTRANAFANIVVVPSDIGASVSFTVNGTTMMADRPTETHDLIPDSLLNMASLQLTSPAVTGTGYEEFTIIYSPGTIQRETGALERIEVTNKGSYPLIPSVSVVPGSGRTGTGGKVYPSVKDIGKVSDVEFIDGGTHNVFRGGYAPVTFFLSNLVGTFQVGETVTIGGFGSNTFTVLRTTQNYLTIKNDPGLVYTSFNTLFTGVTVTGVLSGATASTGLAATITGATRSKPCVITTSAAHNLVDGERIGISGVSGMTQLNNNSYFVKVTAYNKFMLFTDLSLTTLVDASAFSTYVSNGTIRYKIYDPYINLYPGEVTLSRANGVVTNYENDKNLLVPSSKLQDSYYYQDYSYVIRSGSSYQDWEQYFNKIVHPAGFAVFGEVDYFTENVGVSRLGNTTVTNGVINNTRTATSTTETTT
jgi:hypothetical protein